MKRATTQKSLARKTPRFRIKVEPQLEGRQEAEDQGGEQPSVQCRQEEAKDEGRTTKKLAAKGKAAAAPQDVQDLMKRKAAEKGKTTKAL